MRNRYIRRTDSQNKTGGLLSSRRLLISDDLQVLEHAEHDRADNGECDIRGHHAQSPDEWTGEDHLGNLPGSRRCPHQQPKWRSVPRGKSQPCCLFRILDSAEPSAAWLKIREINALKSP